MALEFATIDFETTGFSTRNDRVVEVGIVRTSETGLLIAEYSSLVNPARDVGRSDIHGITPSMLRDAPSFAEIAGDVVSMLDGAVVTAHNARFDKRFLLAELERAGLAATELDTLCTIDLLRALYADAPRKLTSACAHFGVELCDAHAALDDARMASQLLHLLLPEVPRQLIADPFKADWIPAPVCQARPREVVVSTRRTEGEYLAMLVDAIPDSAANPMLSAGDVAEYLNLLDEVLEDRKLTAEEARALAELAASFGLTSHRLDGIHASYVAALCAQAKADGVVTASEMKDLEDVAELLNVGEVKRLIEMDQRPSTTTSRRLPEGAAVCFTGEMSLSRSEIERRAINAGLIVKTGVSKKLDLLVVADADSSSGKAKKARELGVRIVAEPVFLGFLAEIPA